MSNSGQPLPAKDVDQPLPADLSGIGLADVSLILRAANFCLADNLWMILATLGLYCCLFLALAGAFVVGLAATFANSGAGNPTLQKQAAFVLLSGLWFFISATIFWLFRGASHYWRARMDSSEPPNIEVGNFLLLAIVLGLGVAVVEWAVACAAPMLYEFVSIGISCSAPFAILLFGSIAIGFVVLEGDNGFVALARTLRLLVASPAIFAALVPISLLVAGFWVLSVGLSGFYLVPLMGALGAPAVLCATGRRDLLVKSLRSPSKLPEKIESPWK